MEVYYALAVFTTLALIFAFTAEPSDKIQKEK